ncbi:MAG TPA: AbrB/MazE/SpoVT family DNA-binding domain-containing protein [Thermoanaerobaculia bacterium]|nr:AbrB/MazE/SpoVT family DNA-binding domain-containing protein [Thermoanaerobaculia bacterium]
MSKVTSKLQLTLPKVIAEMYGIAPGDEVYFEPAGAFIRIVPPRARAKRLPMSERLRIFDMAMERVDLLQAGIEPAPPGTSRGWTREELYDRGGPR